MAFWNKKVDIGEGKKYDSTEIQKEELTPEQLKELEKKNAKLIDIYKGLDGDSANLSNFDLALAMDGFVSAADKDCDGKLSNDDLNSYAKSFNEEFGLTGKDAVKGKDFKNFIKSYHAVTKGNEKVSTKEVFYDNIVEDFAKEQNWTPVNGQKNVFQDADGRVFMPSPDDKNKMVQSVYSADSKSYVPMSDEHIAAQEEQIKGQKYTQKADAAAKEQNYEKTEDNGIYKAADGMLYLAVEADDGSISFKTCQKNADGEYSVMTDAQVAAQKGGFEDAGNGIYSKDGNSYIYQDGKMQRAHVSGGKMVVMSDEAIANSTPGSYTIQLNESYDDLIKRSLKGQHAGEEGYVPSKEEIAAAKAEFEANNKGAVGGKGNKKFLIAGKKVKIAGGLVDKNNSAEVNAKYGAAVEKREAAKQKAEIADAAKAKGYDATYSDSFFVDRKKTGKHYKWDASKKDFVEAKGVYFVDKDGSYKTRTKSSTNDGFYNVKEYNADGSLKAISVRSKDGYTTLHDPIIAAKSLGLRETFATQSEGVYYDEATKTHYRYDADKKVFTPESGYSNIGVDGTKFDEKGQMGNRQLKKDGTDVYKYDDGSYEKFTYDPKTRNVVKSEKYSASNVLEKRNEFDKAGQLTKETEYDANGNKFYEKQQIYNNDGSYVVLERNDRDNLTEECRFDPDGNLTMYIWYNLVNGKPSSEGNAAYYGKEVGSYMSYKVDSYGIQKGEITYYYNGNKIDKETYEELQK